MKFTKLGGVALLAGFISSQSHSVAPAASEPPPDQAKTSSKQVTEDRLTLIPALLEQLIRSNPSDQELSVDREYRGDRFDRSFVRCVINL